MSSRGRSGKRRSQLSSLVMTVASMPKDGPTSKRPTTVISRSLISVTIGPSAAKRSPTGPTPAVRRSRTAPRPAQPAAAARRKARSVEKVVLRVDPSALTLRRSCSTGSPTRGNIDGADLLDVLESSAWYRRGWNGAGRTMNMRVRAEQAMSYRKRSWKRACCRKGERSGCS